MRIFSAVLNSADASTVHLHNRSNFSHLPVHDTLSTYPSAGLKNEKGGVFLPWGFVASERACVRACLRCLTNHLAWRRGGLQERTRWNYYKKNTNLLEKGVQRARPRLVHEVTICHEKWKKCALIYFRLDE